MRLFDILSTRFENFDQTVQSYLQKAMASIGVAYKPSQIFGAILTAVKGVMQNAMFYIEDAFTEQNIFTAVRKKSIFNLAKISGYKPFYGQAACGTALISVIGGSESVYTSGTNPVSKLYISNGSQLRDTNTGLVYTIMMPVDEYVIDVSKPLLQHEFKIVEGSYYIAQYTASGYLFETFDVGAGGLWDSNYIEITVNGEKYTEISCIYDAGPTDNVFVIRSGFDSIFSVSFGNGTYGRCLSEGDTIKIKYLKHNGTSGNVYINNIKSGQFMFDTMLSDSSGNSVNGAAYLNIDIKQSISGGTDADTIREVKNAIGCESSSTVYVTPENFTLFLKRFSFVGWCSVVTSSDTLNVTGMCLKDTSKIITDTLSYYNIEKEDLLLTEYEKNMMVSALENSGKLFAGVTFSLQDPIIRQFGAVCYVKLLNNSINRDSATERIRKVFADYFMSITNSTLFVPKSDIIVKVMEECSDIVSSFQFDFISETAESAYKHGSWTKYVNTKSGSWSSVSVTYEPNTTPLLDDFGNITLTSEIEVPFLHGGFKYYPDKSKTDEITVSDAVQCYYI